MYIQSSWLYQKQTCFVRLFFNFQYCFDEKKVDHTERGTQIQIKSFTIVTITVFYSPISLDH